MKELKGEETYFGSCFWSMMVKKAWQWEHGAASYITTVVIKQKEMVRSSLDYNL